MPNLERILLRNIFNIIPSLIQLFFTIQIYNDADFENITGFTEYSMFTQQDVGLQATNMITGVIVIVDAMVLIGDKNIRSLHDKIGGTCVIHRRE